MPAGAATGCSGRRGASRSGTGHDRFCLSRRGKIAASDVRSCYSCDWCDAPGAMGACYRSVTMFGWSLRGGGGRRRWLLSVRAAHRADRRDRIGQEHRVGAPGRAGRRRHRRRPDRAGGRRARDAGPGRGRRGLRRAGARAPTGRWTGRRWPPSSSPTPRPRQRLDGIVHPLVRARAAELAAAVPDGRRGRPRRPAAGGDRSGGAPTTSCSSSRPIRRPGCAGSSSAGSPRRTPGPASRPRRPTSSAGRWPTSSWTTAAREEELAAQVDRFWAERVAAVG